MKIEDLSKLCDQVAPGPFRIERQSDDGYLVMDYNDMWFADVGVDEIGALFITEARTALPELLAEVTLWRSTGLTPEQAGRMRSSLIGFITGYQQVCETLAEVTKARDQACNIAYRLSNAADTDNEIGLLKAVGNDKRTT